MQLNSRPKLAQAAGRSVVLKTKARVVRGAESVLVDEADRAAEVLAKEEQPLPVENEDAVPEDEVPENEMYWVDICDIFFPLCMSSNVGCGSKSGMRNGAFVT